MIEDDSNKIMNSHELDDDTQNKILYGYIRECEKLLYQQNIPPEVYILCFNFFFTQYDEWDENNHSTYIKLSSQNNKYGINDTITKIKNDDLSNYPGWQTDPNNINRLHISDINMKTAYGTIFIDGIKSAKAIYE